MLLGRWCLLVHLQMTWRGWCVIQSPFPVADVSLTVWRLCRYYTLLAWLPSYFELALGLNVESSSLLTLIPYIAMVIMTPLVGPVADGLVKKGWSLTSVRKLAQVGLHSHFTFFTTLLPPSSVRLRIGMFITVYIQSHRSCGEQLTAPGNQAIISITVAHRVQFMSQNVTLVLQALWSSSTHSRCICLAAIQRHLSPIWTSVIEKTALIYALNSPQTPYLAKVWPHLRTAVSKKAKSFSLS